MKDARFSILIHLLHRIICTAIGNSGHSLNQDCGIISIYLKGVSDGETKNEETSPPSLKPKLFLRHSAVKVHKRKCVGVRVFDAYGISTTNLILTLRNCGLNKRMHYTLLCYRFKYVFVFLIQTKRS